MSGAADAVGYVREAVERFCGVIGAEGETGYDDGVEDGGIVDLKRMGCACVELPSNMGRGG